MIKFLKMFGRVQRGEKGGLYSPGQSLVFSPVWNPNTVGVEIPRLLSRAEAGSCGSERPILPQLGPQPGLSNVPPSVFRF